MFCFLCFGGWGVGVGREQGGAHGEVLKTMNSLIPLFIVIYIMVSQVDDIVAWCIVG